MPTFNVTLRDKTSGTTINTKAVAFSPAELKIDRARYDVVNVTPDPETLSVTPHTAAANGEAGPTTINLLAAIDHRLERMHRRRTGVVSIMLGVFLGLSLFALAAFILATALGRSF